MEERVTDFTTAITGFDNITQNSTEQDKADLARALASYLSSLAQAIDAQKIAEDIRATNS